MSRNLCPTKIPLAYWLECIEDERQLAPLMGWARVSVPIQLAPNAWLYGANRAEFTSEVGPGLTHNGPIPLPRWRRDALAMGELIERVPANVRWDAALDMVHVWMDPLDGPALAYAERFADHPSDGMALRKALVRLAIAYLGARRAAGDAARHAARGAA